MKKKTFILGLLAITSTILLGGCNKKKQEPVDIVDIPTPTIDEVSNGDVVTTKDPNIVYESEDNDFVLFVDGRNTYTDKLSGYAQTSILPQQYVLDYASLLNHDFSYQKDDYLYMEDDYVVYKEVAQYNGVIETHFSIGNYSIRNLLPLDLFNSDILSYCDYQLVNEKNNLYILSALINEDKQSIVANWYFDYTGDNLEEYANGMKDLDANTYAQKLSYYVTFPQNSKYEFIKQGTVIIFLAEANIKQGIFSECDLSKTTGKIAYIFDTNNGTTIIHYVGTDKDVITNVANINYLGGFLDDMSSCLKIKRN